MAGETAHESHWRARWRAKDFSWDGLADWPWWGWSIGPDGAAVESASAPIGSRPANLQDYWRSEEPQLIDGDGKRWTRAHCPLAWQDGSPTPKALWSDAERGAFSRDLLAKLAVAGETVHRGTHLHRQPLGADRRAQLQGCILFGLPQLGDGAPISARFDKAYFIETITLTGAAFLGHVNFGGAHFARGAAFGRVVFLGEASFEGATFSGNVGFESATFRAEAGFDRAVFLQNARFDHAVFEDLATFDDAAFTADASFDRARFSSIASFVKTLFSGDARFAHASFASDARFDGTTFAKQIDFRHAGFARPAGFSNAALPASSGDFSASFRGARFADVADFTGSGAHFVAAFDEAIIDGKVLLDDIGEGPAEREFRRVLRSLGKAVAKTQDPRRPVAPPARLLKELEGGCRTVKVAMGRDRDEAMEQRYYRYQLIARRKQKSTPLAERLYSHLYATFSDYGMGLWQPFAALLFLAVGFGMLYWLWGEALGGFPHGLSIFPNGAFDQDAWDAMLLSANNVFRPFGVWSAEFHQNIGSEWIGNFLSAKDAGQDGGQRLAIRLVATLQSILAVILFFLFGLAVRRRFQIG